MRSMKREKGEQLKPDDMIVCGCHFDRVRSNFKKLQIEEFKNSSASRELLWTLASHLFHQAVVLESVSCSFY